jgi:hypothetical protein
MNLNAAIVVSWSGGNFLSLMWALQLNGLGASAAAGTVGTSAGANTSTALSVNSPATLDTPLGLVIGWGMQLATTTGQTFTQSGAFTNVVSLNAGAANRPSAYVSYLAPVSTAQVTFSGTTQGSSWWANTYQFKGTSGGVTPFCTFSTLGVGAC